MLGWSLSSTHREEQCLSEVQVSDSVFDLQGRSESGHHHDGPPEEDLEQYPGHEIPAAEHKWPQEASLITALQTHIRHSLTLMLAKGQQGGEQEKGHQTRTWSPASFSLISASVETCLSRYLDGPAASFPHLKGGAAFQEGQGHVMPLHPLLCPCGTGGPHTTMQDR